MILIQDVKARAMIQDLGRFGLREWGIGQAGAMDTLALQAGNILLGNAPNCAAIEIALGGLTVQFQQDTHFCVTGALYEMQLDGKPVHSYWRYVAYKGQVLTMKRANVGMYGYLCVQGGIDVAEELGSRSTDLKAQIGGMAGRALVAGDCLPLGKLQNFADFRPLAEIGIAPLPFKSVIHALPSSEYHAFQRKAQYRWWQNSWTVQSNSDRMGYRLQGAPLELIKPLEMLSHAIQIGTVQVPPSGQPIVLMADAQTTGGYPKIATVIHADLGSLAQARLGSNIKFELVNLAQAQTFRQKNEVYLNQIRRIVNETDRS